MGNIIYPACRQPIFLLPDQSTAFKCGSFNLIIFSAIITIICLVVLIFKFRKTKDDPVTKKPVTSINWITIIICIIIIIIAWLLVPLFGWINARSWTGEQMRIQALIDASGGKLTRADVIKQLQEMYNKEQQVRMIASLFNSGHSRRQRATGNLVGDLIRIVD